MATSLSTILYVFSVQKSEPVFFFRLYDTQNWGWTHISGNKKVCSQRIRVTRMCSHGTGIDSQVTLALKIKGMVQ